MNAMHMHRVGTLALRAILAAAPVAVSGCQVTSPKPSITPAIEPDIAVSPNQGRLRMRSLVDPMCGQIEAAADAIIASSDDRAVRLAALNWKIDAVPALREALFQPGWNTAALDTLVLCIQMGDYFESGPGKAALGPASAQAVAACRSMQQEFTTVLASATFSGDVGQVTSFAQKWAADHPIQHAIADRPSTLTRAFERDSRESMSAGETVAEAAITLDDLNRKIEVYSEQLFRQARWEAERFTMELVPTLHLDQAMSLAQRADDAAEKALPLAERAMKSAEQVMVAMERMEPSVARVAKVAEDAPALVASERQAAIQAAHEEIGRAIDFAHEERMEVLDKISEERSIALKEFNDTLLQQRQALVAEADQLTAARIDYAARQLTRLVALTVAAAAVILLMFLFAARRIFVRRTA